MVFFFVQLKGVGSRRGLRRTASVKFDLERMKSEGQISLPLLNLLNSSGCKNQNVDMVQNPFDSGE